MSHKTFLSDISQRWRPILKSAWPHPEDWHRPNVAEFEKLHQLLLPYAESGDMFCQYACATITWLRLCCESMEEFIRGHSVRIEEATRWWIAAAMQVHEGALDNLITDGNGSEADRAREVFRQVEQECLDLVGRSEGMPVYGQEFFVIVQSRLYGKMQK